MTFEDHAHASQNLRSIADTVNDAAVFVAYATGDEGTYIADAISFCESAKARLETTISELKDFKRKKG